jgi:hypothetical protein
MRIVFAVIVALAVTVATAPPTGVTLTSVRSTSEPLWFSNPALRLSGTIKPVPGSRFEVVVLALADEPIDGELRQFVLTTVGGATYEPIAAGGGPDLIFPLDSMPLGREVGQILPNDALVTLQRTTSATVMLEADPHATLAFVFQVPHSASVQSLKLPGGAQLALTK